MQNYDIIAGQIKCRFCSTYTSVGNEKCSSCGAPLPKRSNLSAKDKENLTNYIRSIDNSLSLTKSKADKQIGFYFVLLSIFAIASIVFFYFVFFEKYKLLFWMASILWFFVLFVVFGLVVTTLENKFVKNKFETITKFEIREYLKEMNYTTLDFINISTSVLNDKSQLIKFITDI